MLITRLLLLQVFANESKALLDELPSLADNSGTFFSAETSGNAPSSLDYLQQDLGEAISC